MNRMAGGVLKEMDNQQKKEDEMIAKYERLRETKLRQQEEDKAKKRAKEQKFILETLEKQKIFRETQKKEQKDDLNKQGAMWAKEREIWQAEEKRIQEKIQQVKSNTVAYLDMQKEERQAKKTKKMDPMEKALNKGMIRDIKAKQKAMASPPKAQ